MPLLSKLNREVKDSESVVQELTVSYESSRYLKREIPKDASEFWEIQGRNSITNKLNQIFGAAKKSINYSTSASGLIRAYKAHSENLEKSRKKGVSVRILSSISSENSAVAREFSQIIQLKKLDKPFRTSFVSVDTREFIIIESKPDDLRTDRGSDVAVWTTNKPLIELHEQLFDRLWNILPDTKIT